MTRSQEWYTAAELAGLPGMPKHARGVTLWGDRGDLQRRKRERGKGWEYHIASLPEDTRAHIAARQLSTPRTEAGTAGGIEGRRLAVSAAVDQATATRQRQAGLAATAAANPRAQVRMDAKLAILAALDEFTRASGLSSSKAVHAFAAQYNLGQVAVEGWVRDTIPDVHPATLYRWRKALQQEGAAALGGRYSRRKGASKIDTQPELRDFIQAMLVDHPDAAPSHVMKSLRARFGQRSDIELPSKRSVERWVGNWKRDNAQVYTALSNPDAWKNQYMTAMGSASADVIALNQRWELDSTPADVMLLDGRHSLIGVIDVFSRRAKLLVSKTSKATAVGTLTRRALLDWGVPDEAKTDNGSDYTSRHMRRVLAGLDIEHLLCNPFSAWEKPHVERLFRTFSHDLVELLPGYIGHDVTDRQAIEARQAFADRLFKKDSAVEVRMTAAEFQQFADRWIEDIYHQQSHSGLGDRTPFQVYTGWSGPVRRIDNERALDVLLAEAPGDGMRTVTKKGIKLDRLEYIHPDLGAYVGDRVHVRYDPDDLGRIYVFDHDGFVCIAEAPAYTGIDRKEVASRARQKQKQAVQEERRALKAAARKVGTKEIAQEILDDAARRNNAVALRPAGETHTTEALEAAAEAADARDRTQPERVETDEDRAAHERMAAEMEAERKAPVVELADSPEQRYARAYHLERRMQRGERVADTDRAWLERYQTTSEYRAQRDFHEDFGLTPEWREAE